MSVDSNSFVFELEESLFFEKGQEVEELRGISIEPEITIESLDNYISIHGNLELQGEYQKVNGEEEGEEIFDFDQIQAKRYVESIREVNGLYVFTHKFPVDISVPPHRVNKIEDVTVQIESFDYDLLGADSLKITAAVEIQGILQDEAYRPSEENWETAEADQEQVGDTFSFEIELPEEALTRNEQTISENQQKLEELLASEEEIKPEVEPILEESPPEEALIRNEQAISKDQKKMEELLTLEESYSEEEPEDDPDRWKVKSQPLSEYFESLSKGKASEDESEEEEQVEEVLEAEEDMEMTGEEPGWDVADESEVIDYIEDTFYPDTPREEEILVAEEPKKEEERTESESLLSQIFREADEDHYAKMRLCIVQENDTIDTIAERFAISPLQLIKHNQLEEELEVNEGQLLYIPSKQ
ncbi:hypothetical protein J18TS1_01410 [Oceanobacillus oncorhynchi subsp. incaldanensis]|uniref:Stage VI sporulation protein D n=1 Tax=Oceanobacillus oncorhynchi TaxID=545501 RepID=A0A0A1MEV7_9BACI|nr:stage VI sporulation protein D [Oceanobacillus oncorhynchi]GIO17041.1 hypothetical protein J18TS1_01410 [Oceanobacillus oncorhynchi subsp. incaldanensis]CEI83905.1 Stage VI sporulation protein D [Oceanobacillus oncorhynchi]